MPVPPTSAPYTPVHPPVSKAKAGAVLVRGRRTRKGPPQMEFHRGEGVSEADFEYFHRVLREPRPSILNCVSPWPEPEPGLLDELAIRGYDLATFSFTIRQRAYESCLPTRVRTIPSRPDRLLARWSQVEYDIPDLCTSWGLRARRGDSAMLQGFFSMNPYHPLGACDLRDLRRSPTFLQEVKARGFDIRSIRLAVTCGPEIPKG